MPHIIIPTPSKSTTQAYDIIVCIYKQSRSGQLPFCASPIFHFEIDLSFIYNYLYTLSPYRLHQDATFLSSIPAHTIKIVLPRNLRSSPPTAFSSSAKYSSIYPPISYAAPLPSYTSPHLSAPLCPHSRMDNNSTPPLIPASEEELPMQMSMVS